MYLLLVRSFFWLKQNYTDRECVLYENKTDENETYQWRLKDKSKPLQNIKCIKVHLQCISVVSLHMLCPALYSAAVFGLLKENCSECLELNLP